MNTTKLLATALIAVSAFVSPATAATDNDLSRRMAIWQDKFEHAQQSALWREYFKCDYTTRTCMKGYMRPSGGSIFLERYVVQVLDDDRKTVLRHVFCDVHGGTRNLIYDCYQVESGKRMFNNYDRGDW